MHFISRPFHNALIACSLALMFSGMIVAALAFEVRLGFSPGRGPDVVDISEIPAWMGHAIIVREVIDERQKTVGKSGEIIGFSKNSFNQPITTRDHVAPICGRAFVYVLSKNGIIITEKNPSIIVQPTLKSMLIYEGNSYKAKIVMDFTVYDQAGTQIWRNVIADSSTFWGHSQAEEPLLCAFGNSIIGVTKLFLSDTGLYAAISQIAKPVAPVESFTIRSPRDLGIRGQYTSTSIGGTIASVLLVGAGIAIFAAGQTSPDQMTRTTSSIVSIPFFGSGAIVGTICLVQWSMWASWQSSQTVLKNDTQQDVTGALSLKFKI